MGKCAQPDNFYNKPNPYTDLELPIEAQGHVITAGCGRRRSSNAFYIITAYLYPARLSWVTVLSHLHNLLSKPCITELCFLSVRPQFSPLRLSPFSSHTISAFTLRCSRQLSRKTSGHSIPGLSKNPRTEIPGRHFLEFCTFTFVFVEFSTW